MGRSPTRFTGSDPDLPAFDARLERLEALLDRGLDDPIREERDPAGRTIWVFGEIGYRVSERQRAVYPVCRGPQRGRVALRVAVDLLTPLSSHECLRLLEPDAALARRAYWRLRRDPRFRELRRRLLPEALALDPELVRIALKARRLPFGGSLGTPDFNRAWRHEAAFRACARENPRLLPLVNAAFADKDILRTADAVHALHRLFREHGVSPAAWRYLCRYGTRFLRPAWRRSSNPVSTTILVLRALEAAGLPPPPPAWAMRAWLGRGLQRDPSEHPLAVPDVVTGLCFQQVHRVRGRVDEMLMQEDLNLVLDWASAAQPRPDRLQRRAGWPWLLRHARAWARLSALQAEGPHAWPCALQVLESETHRATVVSTIEALVEAGIAFRNCLGSLAHRCQSGAVRFFVVHERDSGRRAGVFSLQFEEATRLWRVGEVKGFANLHPPAPVWLLAAMASMAYSEASGRAPHASEWVDRMVACLDAHSDPAGSDPDSVGAQPDTVHGV